MADQGTFIVLEGADGSGKGTQFRLLQQRLEAVGYEVAVFDFPRYDKPSSHFVRRYLNGEYGPAAHINPYTASLFYALDRYEAAPEIKQALNEGKIVLANRFVGSNMAHMGSKIEDPIEQRSFFVWEDSLEFQLLGLPRPNINIFLHVPAEVSYELIAKKASRTYTSKSRDEHEADMEHLKKTVGTYELLCKLFPTDFARVDCMIGNKLLDVPEINNRIWALIQSYLPAATKNAAHSVILKLNEVHAEPKKDTPSTSTEHDIGLVSLDLLSHIETFDSSLIDYELDWRASGFKYLTPSDLEKKLASDYRKFIDSLIAQCRKTKSAARHIMPGGALLNARLRLGSDSRSLIWLLETIDSDESRKVLSKIKQFSPGPTKTTQKNRQPQSAQPEQLGHIMSKLAKDNLRANLSADTEPVRLFEAVPRNEFRLLADIVYPFSNLSLAEIQATLDKWSYPQKAETLQAAILDKSKALGDVHYRFDLLLDRPTIHKLLAQGVVREASLQTASPRFGYDLPPNLTAEEEVEIEACFDSSLEMFSRLQAGNPKTAPLVVLNGHRQRIHTLIELPKLSHINDKLLPGEILRQIKDNVSEVHPIIGASLDKEPVANPETPKKSSHSKKRRKRRQS